MSNSHCTTAFHPHLPISYMYFFKASVHRACLALVFSGSSQLIIPAGWALIFLSVFVNGAWRLSGQVVCLTRQFNSDVLLKPASRLFCWFLLIQSKSYRQWLPDCYTNKFFSCFYKLFTITKLFVVVVFCFLPQVSDFSLSDYSSSLVLCKICHYTYI